MSELQNIALDDLVPHPDNPRLALREDVVESISRQLNGHYPSEHAILVRPIDGAHQIVSGHHRVEAAKRSGFTEIPAWVREMDDKEAFMQLVLGNAQGELAPLEIGMHALKAVPLGKQGRGKKGGLRQYARAINRDEKTVRVLRAAAEVAVETKNADKLRIFSPAAIAAVHAAERKRDDGTIDRAAWPLLVRELVEQKWSIDDTKSAVKAIDIDIDERWSEWLPRAAVIERILAERRRSKKRFTAAKVEQLIDVVEGALAVFKNHGELGDQGVEKLTAWLVEDSGGDSWDLDKVREKQLDIEKWIEEQSEERAERYTLIQCDIRQAHEHVKAASVDVIITDPPYPAEYVELFRDLSRFAAHALKPGGSLVAMVGHSYLPDYLALLSDSLTYHWTACYLTPGGQAVQLWERNVNTFWKPLLWFVNGEYNGDWVGDVTKSDVNDNDKQHHHWGQSESGMLDIVERFSKPGDLICDPFCGAGTTGVVALAADRRFVGIDIDADHLETAEDRLAGR